MSFNSKSIDSLLKLRKDLPQNIETDKSSKNANTNSTRKLHPIETEDNPQKLFHELMNASQDGSIPSHLLSRLQQTEQKQQDSLNTPTGNRHKEHTSSNSSNPMPLQQQKTDIHGEYVLFEQLLLEDEI